MLGTLVSTSRLKILGALAKMVDGQSARCLCKSPTQQASMNASDRESMAEVAGHGLFEAIGILKLGRNIVLCSSWGSLKEWTMQLSSVKGQDETRCHADSRR